MDYNEKQIQIIEVAERMFANRGFSGTSIRDIAHEANINISMISYYFGSKEKLMEAIFEKKIQVIRTKNEQLLQNKELSPMDKLNIVIEQSIDKAMCNTQFHKIIIREQLFEENNNYITELITDLKKQNLELLKGIIKQGQKINLFKKDLDYTLLYNALTGIINNTISTQHFYKEVNNIQSMPEEEFQKHLKKKLSNYLKNMFKATLTYEKE